MRVISDNYQSLRPTVVEEESKREDEDDLGFTKDELQEAEEIREKEFNAEQQGEQGGRIKTLELTSPPRYPTDEEDPFGFNQMGFDDSWE